MNAQLTMADIKSLLLSSAQLLAGWVALALSTATLGLFPDFPVFSVIDDDTKHDPLRLTHRRVPRHDNAVGMWVAAEPVFFYVGGRRARVLLPAHRHSGTALLLLSTTSATHSHQIRNLVRPQHSTINK